MHSLTSSDKTRAKKLILKTDKVEDYKRLCFSTLLTKKLIFEKKLFHNNEKKNFILLYN